LARPPCGFDRGEGGGDELAIAIMNPRKLGLPGKEILGSVRRGKFD
jgi:hypothetical protein